MTAPLDTTGKARNPRRRRSRQPDEFVYSLVIQSTTPSDQVCNSLFKVLTRHKYDGGVVPPVKLLVRKANDVVIVNPGNLRLKNVALGRSIHQSFSRSQFATVLLLLATQAWNSGSSGACLTAFVTEPSVCQAWGFQTCTSALPESSPPTREVADSSSGYRCHVNGFTQLM